MPLSPSLGDRENQKFRDAGDALTRVAVDIEATVLPPDAATNTTLTEFKDTNHQDLLDVQTKLDAIISNTDEIDVNTDDLETLITASNSKLDSIITNTSNIDGHVDGLEGLIGTTNSTLSTIDGHVDGLEALVTSTNTKLDTLISQTDALEGNTDGLEGLIGTTNTEIGATNESAASTDTATSGINGLLKRLNQHQTTQEGKQDTLNAFYNSNFGAAIGGIRTASLLGNASGIADFNSGVATAQTLRTASNLYDASANALTTRSYASVRPLDVYMPQIGSSSVTHTRTTLTANTSTQIAATNTNRKWLYISNQSGATVYIKFGVTAVINQGIEISNNTIWKMSAVELYLGIINVIVGSNNRTIEIIEAS